MPQCNFVHHKSQARTLAALVRSRIIFAYAVVMSLAVRYQHCSVMTVVVGTLIAQSLRGEPYIKRSQQVF